MKIPWVLPKESSSNEKMMPNRRMFDIWIPNQRVYLRWKGGLKGGTSLLTLTEGWPHMGITLSQITCNSTVCLIAYSRLHHRDHQMSACEGKSTGDRWIPLTKGQLCRKRSHAITSSYVIMGIFIFHPTQMRRGVIVCLVAQQMLSDIVLKLPKYFYHNYNVLSYIGTCNIIIQVLK